MKQQTTIVVLTFLLAIGAGLSGYYLGIGSAGNEEFAWQSLSLRSNETGVIYKFDAVFNPDISLPDINDLSRKAKFLPSVDSEDSTMDLGYIVLVDVAKLNLEKVPESYKQERSKQIQGTKVTVAPIEEVVYAMHVEFALLDGDGFELVSLEGSAHTLRSGEINRYQDTVRNPVSIDIARRTKEIILHMTVERCLTCESNVP